MSCEALFQKGRIDNFERAPEAIYSSKEDLDLHRLVSKYFRLLPNEKIKVIPQFLKRNQVDFIISSQWKIFPVPQYYEQVEILPMGQSELNRLAKKISDLYGARMVYAPYFLDKYSASGAYDEVHNIIYISHNMALMDLPDLTYLHEIRHMAMTRKEMSGKSSIINGRITKLKYLRNKWPWGAPSKSGYESDFDVQEAETWHQNFVYSLADLRQLNQDGRLTFSELQTWIGKIENRNPESILEDILSLVEYEIEGLHNRVPSITFDSGRQEIQFGKTGWLYSYSHHIPKAFIEKYHQKNHSGIAVDADSIRTPQGREFSQKMVKAYLEELRQNILEKADFYARGKALLYEIQRRANYLAAARRPISDLYGLISQVGRDFDWRAIDTNTIQMSSFSRFDELGVDFSTLEKGLYRELSQRFSSEDEVRDLEKFILQANFEMASSPGYMKAEFTYLRGGLPDVLILEGVEGLDIRQIGLHRLIQAGLEVTRIKISAIDMNRFEKNQNSKIDSAFLKMPNEEVVGRNQLRIDRVLEKTKSLFPD